MTTKLHCKGSCRAEPTAAQKAKIIRPYPEVRHPVAHDIPHASHVGSDDRSMVQVYGGVRHDRAHPRCKDLTVSLDAPLYSL